METIISISALIIFLVVMGLIFEYIMGKVEEKK